MPPKLKFSWASCVFLGALSPALPLGTQFDRHRKSSVHVSLLWSQEQPRRAGIGRFPAYSLLHPLHSLRAGLGPGFSCKVSATPHCGRLHCPSFMPKHPGVPLPSARSESCGASCVLAFKASRAETSNKGIHHIWHYPHQGSGAGAPNQTH